MIFLLLSFNVKIVLYMLYLKRVKQRFWNCISDPWSVTNYLKTKIG